MLVDVVLKLIPKLISDCQITNFNIRDANNLAHINEKKPEDSPLELDILVEENLYHWQIQELDKILADFDNVEMRLTDDGLFVYEKEKEAK